MKAIKLLLALTLTVSTISAQQLTTTVRGVVVDRFSKAPLQGVNVILLDSLAMNGVSTSEGGRFSIADVPIGRASLEFSYLGYKPVRIDNFITTSGREVALTIEMEEDPHELEGVVIASVSKGDPRNGFAYVSSRGFDVEATERYAGTNGDPARMATYFAGVMAAGDTRNDIIIRGNSPLGLLWRLEGVDIPNPSHFASFGTNGGAMSILNNNQLANSDFLTGAFPAQYGNALSGAFDLHMRNGNSSSRETTVQFGSGGLELGLEGPFSKNSSASYMVNYRYSFLELFSILNVPIDLPVIPMYQDISFKFNAPLKRGGYLSLWGIGGKSHMDMLAEDNTLSMTAGLNNEFGSSMGATGLTHSLSLGSNTLVRTTLALTGSQSSMNVDSVKPDGSVFPFYAGHFTDTRGIAKAVLRHRFTRSFRLEAGATLTHININFGDSALMNGQFFDVIRGEGSYSLAQAYGQAELNITQKLKLTGGAHFQYLSLNGTHVLEPRAALEYSVTSRTSVHLGQGLHSQAQQGNVYFHKTLVDTLAEVYSLTNKDLGFTRSYHAAAGVRHNITPNLRFSAEAYYQYLFDIPVERRSTGYSLVNFGADYFAIIMDSLENTGTGSNVGVELSLERFFSRGLYYMANLSLYDSRYRGSDGVQRNTMFNGRYILNLLGGYEFRLPKNEVLAVNANLSWAGGMRHTPIDLEESARYGVTVTSDDYYALQYPDFFRMNIKLIYRINRRRFSYETGFGLNNITNRRNVLAHSFNPATGTIATDYQLGLMPEGLFRIYF